MKRVHALHPVQVERLVAATDDRFRPLVHFLAVTGLRFSEAAALRWANVDLALRRARVTEGATEVNGVLCVGGTKTRKSVRDVPLTGHLVQELATLMPLDADPQSLVFASPRGGMLRISAFRKRYFKPAVLEAGLDTRIRIHDLRHTAISSWIAAGIDIVEVSKRAGHSSITVTVDIYGHLFDNSLGEMSDRLDAYYARLNDLPAPPSLRIVR